LTFDGTDFINFFKIFLIINGGTVQTKNRVWGYAASPRSISLTLTTDKKYRLHRSRMTSDSR